MEPYRRLEDLIVYQKLCRLHLEVCRMSQRWPTEERYELGSQIRRSSNSAAAQLAEKYDDRHVRNKVEGVNRSRGEAAETIHHLYMAHLKGYETAEVYEDYRNRFKECIRMLNGMERTLEKQLPPADRRWPQSSAHEDAHSYGAGFPEESSVLNPEPCLPVSDSSFLNPEP